MDLNVSEALRSPGQEFLFRGEQAIAPMQVLGDEVSFDPVHLEGSYFAADDGSVTVDGTLTATAHSRCANCLRPASAALEIPFRETYKREGGEPDEESFTYGSSLIPMEQLAMTYALLALPMRMLCGEDCPGVPEGAGDGFTLVQSGAPAGRRPFADLGDLLAKQAQKDKQE